MTRKRIGFISSRCLRQTSCSISRVTHQRACSLRFWRQRYTGPVHFSSFKHSFILRRLCSDKSVGLFNADDIIIYICMNSLHLLSEGAIVLSSMFVVFVNAITREPITMKSSGAYGSKTWSNARTSSKISKGPVFIMRH